MTALARAALGTALFVAAAILSYAPSPARAAINLRATKAEVTALGRTHKTAWVLDKQLSPATSR